MVSDRCPGEFFVVPMDLGTPLRLSLPRTRKLQASFTHVWVMGRQSSLVHCFWGSFGMRWMFVSTWRMVAMANPEPADTARDSSPARTRKVVQAVVLRGRWEALSPITLGPTAYPANER